MNLLIKSILNIETADHKQIQEKIGEILMDLGYWVKPEYRILAKRGGKIDVVAKKDHYLIGIEIDHSSIRWKSIDKLNTLNPNLAIFILKSKIMSKTNNNLRSKLIKIRSLIIHLPKKKVYELNGIS